MSNDLVVIHNSIVTSAYSLSVNEQRLIYCALAKMPKREPIEANKAFYVSREDFINAGASPDQVARDIRTATKDLMKRTIAVPTNSGILEFQWLKQVLRYDKKAEQKLREKYPNPEDHKEYINGLRRYNFYDALPINKDDDDIVARIVFSDEILPLISDLHEQFVKLFLSDMSKFSSVYSWRIYQLMMRYKSTGYVKISLDDLRFMLALHDKYPLTADFKKRVIDTAVNDINDQSPYNVKYTLVKKGRKYTHLELKFKPKQTKLDDNKRDPDTVDMFTGATDRELKPLNAKTADMFGNLLSYDSVFGGKYARQGEAMPSFVARIKSELQTVEGVVRYANELKKAGYKPNYRKT
ncbi:RepB family plasmid replication initiator protein [Psychrobacter sanguinis]|uniref:RepB family plasmid replication initiator protein n=1 Tax=Psychrobacter sanguinis TaxID=861445 RepID=UPI001918AF23|nr:RepB family plasmid replication initiator protein [Psychrobacter sanguinis]